MHTREGWKKRRKKEEKTGGNCDGLEKSSARRLWTLRWASYDVQEKGERDDKNSKKSQERELVKTLVGIEPLAGWNR